MQNGLEHPDVGLATLELLDVKSAESGRLETLLVPFSDRFQKTHQQMASQCQHRTCMWMEIWNGRLKTKKILGFVMIYLLFFTMCDLWFRRPHVARLTSSKMFLWTQAGSHLYVWHHANRNETLLPSHCMPQLNIGHQSGWLTVFQGITIMVKHQIISNLFYLVVHQHVIISMVLLNLCCGCGASFSGRAKGTLATFSPSSGNSSLFWQWSCRFGLHPSGGEVLRFLLI